MYVSHFGLRERPFSNTPDPRFVYLGPRHEEALAHLLYGAQEHCGFVQLTGEVGTGKTTVCRVLLERLPAGVDAALIMNPVLTAEELLATLCDELEVKYETPAPSRKVLVDALYRHLLATHAARRRTVLVVDEAQNLSVGALEQLRLLTNLETEKEKLLQIILIGQPELVEMLDRKELRQLAQRISARYHLQPFVESETRAYVNHRLALAGASADIFDERALREVHRRSGGVPRLINAICDRALLGAYAGRRPGVDRSTVRRAAREVLGRPAPRRRPRVSWQRVTAAVLVVLVIAVWAVVLRRSVSHLSLPAMEGRPNADAGASSPAVPDPAAAAPATRVASAAPPAAVPSATVERQPTLAELLQSGQLPDDRRAAFVTLFSRWGLDVHGWNADPCEAATSVGLQCLDVDGGWSKMRRLDLPAVLELRTDGGSRWAPLVALEGDRAAFQVGGGIVKIPLAEIDALWNERFEALWQPPPLGAATIAPGSRGKAVVWLRRRLDALDGLTQSTKSDAYDERLRARVVAFQRSQSLQADGIAGVETLARLSSLIDGRVPSLSHGSR